MGHIKNGHCAKCARNEKYFTLKRLVIIFYLIDLYCYLFFCEKYLERELLFFFSIRVALLELPTEIVGNISAVKRCELPPIVHDIKTALVFLNRCLFSIKFFIKSSRKYNRRGSCVEIQQKITLWRMKAQNSIL